jgi:hypothetical protein
MSTNATGGLGTKLSVQMGSPLAYTTIGEVTSNVDTPVPDKPKYDATHMQSTAKEYVISRLPDNGEVAYESNYDPASASQALVISDSLSSASTLRNFRIEHYADDGTTQQDQFAFAGYFKGGQVTAPVDGIKKLKFSIVVTGAITADLTSPFSA